MRIHEELHDESLHHTSDRSNSPILNISSSNNKQDMFSSSSRQDNYIPYINYALNSESDAVKQ